MSQVDNNQVVKMGMKIGAISTLLLFIILYMLAPKFVDEVELFDRIKLGFSCLVFPAAFFLITIIRVGAQRYGNPSENPVDVVASSNSMEIDLRVLSNTHEQLVIFTLNTLALSVLLPYTYLSLLPIYSALFVVGRILFWVAYKHNVLWRAPGFAMGIMPAVVGISYCCLAILYQVFF
ncbi:MAPEG family protein [Shewanella youngdeokensis]|uniref:MAPEG family protein n=1 Tax=Shewanella youngdeokensis TaxID=2999068 RepID=A0ABZ0JZU2_9GAMM|nr:MAPEG family protein [Shewanella sp. DAU334]